MGKTKILLVDDDLSLGKSVQEDLEATGKFIVFVAQGAHDAVKMAKAFMPNLILLDISTPQSPGSEVVEQLKNDLRTGSIPIIFLTEPAKGNGFHQPDSLYRYLTKPLNMAEVVRCIEEKTAN